MTREEAIEYLKRADITVGQTIKTRTAEAIEMAIKALEQTRWIPVTQPPKEKGKYLVTLSPAGVASQIDVLRYAPNLQEVDAYDFYEEHKAGWYSYDPEYGYCETTDVIAWMPSLPEPYKEESEET